MTHKKLRDEENVFVAEGPKIINELLQASNVRVKQLYAISAWLSENPQYGHVAVEISPAELERISFLQTPNQVCGIFTKPDFSQTVDWRHTVSLMLDNIQDPGNMGTIIRCADWFGIKQIVCSRDSADAWNPKVVQSSMGSICRVQVVYEDLESFIRQHEGIPVYAATLDGTAIYSMPPVTAAGIFLVGNESKGISPGLLALSTHRITIPRIGAAESLNAAVATGIILAEMTKKNVSGT